MEENTRQYLSDLVDADDDEVNMDIETGGAFVFPNFVPCFALSG